MTESKLAGDCLILKHKKEANIVNLFINYIVLIKQEVELLTCDLLKHGFSPNLTGTCRRMERIPE